MGLRIGIDCDGVLRDFIPDLVDSINETHPEYSDKILVPYATSSNFQPYVTTVGLYDDFNRLVAIGKFPRPIKNDPNLAIAFEVKIDT